jgi:hypothetical protein
LTKTTTTACRGVADTDAAGAGDATTLAGFGVMAIVGVVCIA